MPEFDDDRVGDQRPPRGRPEDRLEMGLRPVGSSGRSAGLRTGAVIAVAILAVAAGLGLIGPGSPAAPPASPSAPSTPAPTVPELGDEGCVGAVRRTALQVVLGSPAIPEPPAVGLPMAPDGSAWVVPPVELALKVVSTSNLVVATSPASCIGRVDAVYVSAADPPGAGISRPWLALTPRPAALEVDLGSLPEGDWLVRTNLVLATDPLSFYLAPTITAVFRVIVGPDAPVVVGPDVTPAVACGSGPEAGQQDLVVDGTEHHTSAVATQPIEIALGQSLEIRTPGDACATAWTLLMIDVRGIAMVLESRPGGATAEDAGLQNRWRIDRLFASRLELQADIRLQDGTQVGGAWALHAVAPDLPVATVQGAGARTTLSPGCGAAWAAAPGAAMYEPCISRKVPAGIDAVTVPAGTPLVVDVPGWTVTSWFARCGEAVADREGGEAFAQVNGCELGASASGGVVAFVPLPGDSVVLVGLWLERGGVAAYGNFYVRTSTSR